MAGPTPATLPRRTCRSARAERHPRAYPPRRCQHHPEHLVGREDRPGPQRWLPVQANPAVWHGPTGGVVNAFILGYLGRRSDTLYTIPILDGRCILPDGTEVAADAASWLPTRAVQAVYEHLRTRDDNPCVVIPTAGGKTPVMATICRDAVQRWVGGADPGTRQRAARAGGGQAAHHGAGPVDAGGCLLGRSAQRDKSHPIIVAGIQSIYRRAAELDRLT